MNFLDNIDIKETNKADEDYNLSSESESEKSGKKPAPIHIIINIDAKLCDTYIESKCTKIIKSKRMKPINRKLQEIHTDL